MDFNTIINRKNTGSVKWDLAREDVIPLWVADTDFQPPIEVLQAFEERVKHGVFGYTIPKETYYDALVNWMEQRHQWKIKKDWIVMIPGIVTALNIFVQVFTQENDAVLIQRPVYNPFTDAIVNNNRKLINSPLVLKNNHYEIDFVDFEKKIIEEKVKLFIMCSPHNPCGRVWTKDELIKIGDICLKHNVLIVVDEIHHDLVFKQYKHLSLAALDKKYSLNSITCTAPSKTFNIAGLKNSNIIIENEEIRKKVQDFLKRISLSANNIFGLIGCEVAYSKGAEWLDKLIDYIYDNKVFVEEYLNKHLPMIKVIESEATYLLWLDFRALGMDNKTLSDFMMNEAKVWLNNGFVYGEEGDGFLRLNLGCSRALLEKALTRINLAINKHK